MGWSGGTFTRSHDWTADEAAAIDMEAVRFDQEDDNLAAGINACLTKDGSNEPTADLPMGGNRHTGVGNANARDTYASAADVQDQDLVYFVDSGAADAYVITPSPAITAYEEGQRFVVRLTNTNTGASTLNANALGATAIEDSGGNAMTAGMLVSGGIYEFTYDANDSRFVLTSPAAIVPDARLSANVPLLDAANEFTATQEIHALSASFRWNATGDDVDEKEWDAFATGGVWRLRLRNDDGSAGDDSITITRDGSNVTALDLVGDSISLTGALTATSYGGITEANLVDKSAAETIAGAWTFSADISMSGTRAIDATTRLNLTGATVSVGEAAGILGFYGGAGAIKPEVIGVRHESAGEVPALKSLLFALEALGLITDSTTI